MPILIGADPNRDSDDPDAYPVLATNLYSGVLSIDRDDDGLTDTEEAAEGTDKDKPDTDDDGIPDYYEANNKPYTDPTTHDSLEDADGDGFSNLREYLGDSDPGSIADVPATLLADPDGDLDVDGTELAAFADELGSENCDSVPCDFDLDEDGDVDEIDLLLFAEDYGW